MQFVDARFWSPGTQAVVRELAVLAVLDGMAHVQAAKVFRVNVDTVGRWVRQVEREGFESLRERRRGREPEEQMLLSEEQQDEIRRLVIGKDPEQLMLPFCLWTREAVRDLIYERYLVSLSVRTVGDYLARWEMTCQRPLMRAYEQDADAVSRWLEVEYPDLVRRADSENAVIFWEDETGFRSDTKKGRSYAPRGKTPILRRTGKRFAAVNVVIAMGSTGEYYSKILTGNFNSGEFIGFLEELIQARTDGRKIILIADGHPSHRSGITADWLDRHRCQIELVLLPSYSPELNPVEIGNNDAKYQVHAHNRPRTRPQLIGVIRNYLARCAELPSLVASFFHEEHVRYAALQPA